MGAASEIRSNRLEQMPQTVLRHQDQADWRIPRVATDRKTGGYSHIPPSTSADDFTLNGSFHMLLAVFLSSHPQLHLAAASLPKSPILRIIMCWTIIANR